MAAKYGEVFPNANDKEETLMINPVDKSALTITANDRVIPIYMFSLLAKLLAEQGVLSESLLPEASLTANDLDCPDTKISFEEALYIIRKSVDQYNQPCLGFEIARRSNFATWGLLGYALASCSSGLDAIDKILRYSEVTSFLTENTYECSGENHSIVISPLFPAADVEPFIVEETFGSGIGIVRSIMGYEVKPKEVRLNYDCRSALDHYENFFGCPVVESSGENKIIFTDEMVNLLNPSYNPAAARAMADLCEQTVQANEVNSTLETKVRKMLLSQSGRFLTVREVADGLGMGERTLRRHLAREGISFREISNEVKKDLAFDYLKKSDKTLEEIGILIGFSEYSNFTRAFKQWTGFPPKHFRNNPGRSGSVID